MKEDLRLHRILIRRKSSALDQNLVSLRRRAIERRHHQVQVHRERIHHDDFARLRSHQLCGLLRQQPVIGHPRVLRMKMAFHAKLRPVLQCLVEIRTRRFGLQPERVTAQINGVVSLPCFWDVEALAKMGQRIAGIHCNRETFAGMKCCPGHETSSSGVSSLLNQIVRPCSSRDLPRARSDHTVP